MRAILLFLIAIVSFVSAKAQPCTNPGQTPSTAFPVCGTRKFVQNTVPLCGGAPLPSPHCANQGLTDINPYWYKFTCYESGTLGFVITPNDMSDDYDWELYDVTGTDPNNVFTNGNLVVSSNWSGLTGITGASSAGNVQFSCAGTTQPLWSAMPTLKAGRNYLLLVSHFTNSQSGYTLEFKGGTAVITDPNIPHLRKATPNCGGDVIRVGLGKKIKCSSIAADGSDFLITPAGGNIVSAAGLECTAKFDTDSIELKLNGFLPAGNYSVRIKTGSDGNTLLDYCDNAVPTTDAIDFTVQPNAPTPLDSLVPLACAPRTLQLVFKKPIMCSSIAADGSDFVVNGTYPAGISAVAGNCSGGKTSSITITLSQNLVQAGSFRIQLQTGSDGNTLLDECGIETPAGSFITFNVKDTVNANFTYNIGYGCTEDVVDFSHPGGNGINSWSWILDDGLTSSLQDPQARYSIFDTKKIRLIVGNGFCSDTSNRDVVLENFLKADFSVIEDNCPLEPIKFTATSIGKVTGHQWDFGDGGFGTGQLAMHTYARPNRETAYNVRYTVTDSFGCSKTIQKPVKIYISCTIAVPNAFTPNNDGKNEKFFPMNAVKADKLEFIVFNRWGQRIFRTTNWKQGWDGRLNGHEQPSGTYVWTLRYVNRDTGQQVQRTGTVVLIR